MSERPTPLLAGAGAALLAALSFGVTAPLVARFGAGVGPLTTAALLYAGAAASSLLRFGSATGVAFQREHRWRVGLVALLGAGVAPTLLAWGLQRAGGMVGSLLLNLEAVFTVLLAKAVYREPLGRRVTLAVVLMLGGGASLALATAAGDRLSALGVLAIAAATLAWGLDNTLSRGLAQLEPVRVVAAKATLGALLTATAATLRAEPRPALPATLVLLACGASGYGLSLRFYLLAQRRIGAARTGSLFAVAPFVGGALAFALGERAHATAVVSACLFFGAGIWLHLTERHRHGHVHEPLAHDHPHRHDDGHHDHQHEPPFVGEHSHPHRHERLEHEHEHAPDVHHDHAH